MATFDIFIRAKGKGSLPWTHLTEVEAENKIIAVNRIKGEFRACTVNRVVRAVSKAE